MVLSGNVDRRRGKKGRNWEKQRPVPSQHHPHHHSEKSPQPSSDSPTLSKLDGALDESYEMLHKHR